jgi:hypothetical protein
VALLSFQPRRGGDISAQGKRSVALGVWRHKSEALKGRNNRNVPKAAIRGQQPLVSPFQGFSPDEQRPQGDVWRLTPPHLPWAGMSRPFGAECTGHMPGKSLAETPRILEPVASNLFFGRC